MLEKTIERWLGEELRKAMFLYYKFVSPSNPGVPDRIVICPDGAVYFAELKTETGKLSEQQKVCIRELSKRKQLVIVVHGMSEARYFAELLIRLHGGKQDGEI
jgi:hypothetical protein